MNQAKKSKDIPPLSFVIKPDVFPFRVGVAVQTQRTDYHKLEILGRRWGILGPGVTLESLSPTAAAACWESCGDSLVVLSEYPTEPRSISHLVHELQHAVQNARQHHGFEGREWEAYTIQYLVGVSLQKTIDHLKKHASRK